MVNFYDGSEEINAEEYYESGRKLDIENIGSILKDG